MFEPEKPEGGPGEGLAHWLGTGSAAAHIIDYIFHGTEKLPKFLVRKLLAGSGPSQHAFEHTRANNVLLAIFNLLPLPPLDGGRIMVGALPDSIASALARLEPYGMTILIGVLFILPLLGAQLGMNLDVVWQFINRSTNIVIDAILRSTGNA